MEHVYKRVGPILTLPNFMEIAVLTNLPRHPNIVVLTDIRVRNRGFNLVLEHCGLTLLAILQYLQAKNIGWDVRALLSILAGVGHALDHLHSYNIVHRNVVAEHILISPTGVTKLTSFTHACSAYVRVPLAKLDHRRVVCGCLGRSCSNTCNPFYMDMCMFADVVALCTERMIVSPDLKTSREYVQSLFHDFEMSLRYYRIPPTQIIRTLTNLATRLGLCYASVRAKEVSNQENKDDSKPTTAELSLSAVQVYLQLAPLSVNRDLFLRCVKQIPNPNEVSIHHAFHFLQNLLTGQPVKVPNKVEGEFALIISRAFVM